MRLAGSTSSEFRRQHSHCTARVACLCERSSGLSASQFLISFFFDEGVFVDCAGLSFGGRDVEEDTISIGALYLMIMNSRSVYLAFSYVLTMEG